MTNYLFWGILFTLSLALTRFEPSRLTSNSPTTTPAIIASVTPTGIASPLSPTPTQASAGTATPTPTSSINTPTPALNPLRTTVSNSKLGVFFINSTTEGKEIIRAGPRVIKVIDPQINPALMQLVRDYKTMYPNGIVVMRVWQGTTNQQFTTTDNPENAANTFFNNALQPAINQLSAGDKSLISYLSGPNEFEKLPFFWDPGMLQWTNRFWIQLVNLISSAGFKPLIGDIQVSWPNPISDLTAMIPALTNLRNKGGVFSYHAYSMNAALPQDPNDGNAMRHRMIQSFLANNGLGNLPIILTEGGFASGPYTGYRTLSNDTGFQNWLTWFDNQLIADSSVLGGVTLFQIGSTDPNWDTFDLKYIASWLTNYIATK